jgi:hypothetical protein
VPGALILLVCADRPLGSRPEVDGALRLFGDVDQMGCLQILQITHDTGYSAIRLVDPERCVLLLLVADIDDNSAVRDLD